MTDPDMRPEIAARLADLEADEADTAARQATLDALGGLDFLAGADLTTVASWPGKVEVDQVYDDLRSSGLRLRVDAIRDVTLPGHFRKQRIEPPVDYLWEDGLPTTRWPGREVIEMPSAWHNAQMIGAYGIRVREVLCTIVAEAPRKPNQTAESNIGKQGLQRLDKLLPSRNLYAYVGSVMP